MRGLQASIVVLAAAIGGGAALAADPPTFTVTFADGGRVVGQPIVGWHGVQPQPQCGGRSLFDPGTPARWAVSEPLAATGVPAGPVIEFIGGDRLPGSVEGWRPGRQDPGPRRPPCLVVRPAVPLERLAGPVPATLDVTVDLVSRIVWIPRVGPALPPGTIRLVDGRESGFRSLRWSPDSVLVLTADGTERFSVADLAEVVMPASDPWVDYVRLVAALSPALPARLLRVETVGGMVATAALEPQRGVGDPNDPRTWRHAIQPAWMSESLWLPHADVRRRVFFAAAEPPLTVVHPTAVRRTATFGGSWTWRTDRNVQGGPLAANGGAAGWGYGVQAHCELTLPLPTMASSFRTAVALDQVVGTGGCVRTAVHLDAAGATPIWQSPHLVGTRDPLDTGWIGLPRGGDRARAVVLVADMAHDGRPTGADPHDIRDVVDWIDPMVTLVPEELAAAVVGQVPATVHAWRECDVEGSFAGRVVVDALRGGETPVLVRQVAPRGATAVARSLRVAADEPWLAVAVSRTAASPSRLEIRVDGRTAGVVDVPERTAGQPLRPFLVSLADAVGRTAEVELVPLAVDDQAFVEWWSVGASVGPEPNAAPVPGTSVVLGPPVAGLP